MAFTWEQIKVDDGLMKLYASADEASWPRTLNFLDGCLGKSTAKMAAASS